MESIYLAYSQFKDNFFEIKSTVPDYRIGQSWINCFIKREDNITDYTYLWEEKDINKAEKLIFELTDQLQWGVDNLKLLREGV